jgi:hypothetical protein
MATIPELTTAERFENLVRSVWPEVGPDAAEIMIADLVDMYQGETWSAVIPCFEEWIRRIGGPANLDAYARTLQAGAARRRRS